MSDISNTVLLVVSVIAIAAAIWFFLLARRGTRERDLLLEVGTRISSSLDRDEVLGLILDGLAEVVGYDAAGIFLVDIETDEIIHHMLRGYDEGVLAQVKLKIGDGLVGSSAEMEEPIVVADVRKDPDYLSVRRKTRSEIVIPLMVSGVVVAVLNLESDRVRAYRSRHLKQLQTFGAQAAVAIDNASCYTEAQQKRVIEQELEIAGKIQQALLPNSTPDIPGLDVAAYMKPIASLGGDLYDLVHVDGKTLGIAIGDISGHGTPAAILMASLYASYRSLTRRGFSIPEIMNQLNNLIQENFGISRYATFFYGVVVPEEKRLTYSNAGHFPPLLIRPGEEARFLGAGGIVLGFMNDATYEEERVALESGDVIVLYTDGIIEATSPDEEMFGEERLAEICATMIRRSAREVLDGILKAVMSHCSGSEQQDDISLLIVRIL
ncbi:PP2C family protein-serine/threonine phosphatase [Candidatus Zixiibacteriota bacterium]